MNTAVQETDKTTPDNGRSSVRYKDTVRVTLVGSVVDALLGLVKILVGLVVQSQALIADGVHSLSDLATDIIVLYAARHSHQEADDDHPYGHGRFETVATVGLGVALLGVAFGITLDAAMNLFHPEEHLVPSLWAIAVAAVSILSKEAIYHYTMRVANKYNSNMLRANAWHSRTDAISSVIVLIGVGGTMAGFWYLDAVAAIIVGLMVGKIGWDLSWSSIRELVDTALEPERVEAIRKAIIEVDGVKSLHVLRTRRMAGEALVDVHIQVEPRISVSEGHFVSEKVRVRVIKEIEEVADVMVHIDPEDDEESPLNIRLPSREDIRQQLEQNWRGTGIADQAEDFTLHYLDGRVEVDLVLPVAALGEDPQTRRQALQAEAARLAAELDAVSTVRLYFR